MLTDIQRAALEKEVRGWCGTRYMPHACLKGRGTDCGQLIYGVYRAQRLLPKLDLPKDYSLQVAAHRASTEYMALIDTYFRPVTEFEVKPGDLVCYKIGLAMAHAGIVIKWPSFIVQAELRHGVSGSHGINNPALRERRYLSGTVREFRTLKDEFCGGGL